MNSLSFSEFWSLYPEVAKHLVVWPIFYFFTFYIPVICTLVAKHLGYKHNKVFKVSTCSTHTIMFLVSIIVPSYLYECKYKFLPNPETGEPNENGFTVSEFRHYYPQVVTALVVVPVVSFIPSVLIVIGHHYYLKWVHWLGIGLYFLFPFVVMFTSIGLYCEEYCYWGCDNDSESFYERDIDEFDRYYDDFYDVPDSDNSIKGIKSGSIIDDDMSFVFSASTFLLFLPLIFC